MFLSVCVNHNTPVWVYCGPVCYADVSTVHCETRTVSTSTQCVCSRQYVWTTTPQSGFIVDLYAIHVSIVLRGVTNICLGLQVQKVNWPTMLLPSLGTRPFAPGGRVWAHAYTFELSPHCNSGVSNQISLIVNDDIQIQRFFFRLQCR